MREAGACGKAVSHVDQRANAGFEAMLHCMALAFAAKTLPFCPST